MRLRRSFESDGSVILFANQEINQLVMAKPESLAPCRSPKGMGDVLVAMGSSDHRRMVLFQSCRGRIPVTDRI
jgi:hypothetical protein